MIIYKDIFTDDELFTDTFPMEEVEDGLLLRVKGKLVQEKSEDVKLSGSNPSAEEEAEQMDAAVQSGINVILSARMNEFGLDKKGYTQHIKEYMKALAAKLTEDGKDKEYVESFKSKAQGFVKTLLPKDRFKELQFFCGEKMHPDGMLAICEWEGEVAYIYFFKDGLIKEKL